MAQSVRVLAGEGQKRSGVRPSLTCPFELIIYSSLLVVVIVLPRIHPVTNSVAASQTHYVLVSCLRTALCIWR